MAAAWPGANRQTVRVGRVRREFDEVAIIGPPLSYLDSRSDWVPVARTDRGRSPPSPTWRRGPAGRGRGA